MGENEPILVAKEAVEKDGKTLMENLKNIVDSSDNLRKLACDFYKALKSFEPNNERKTRLMQTLGDIFKFVEENENCSCTYCNVKSKIQVEEICNVTVESGDEFIPKLLKYSFEQEDIDDQLSLTEYSSTFLFLLHLAQFEFFYKQVKMLVDERCLPYNDLLASSCPFYNPKNKLLYMGGRIVFNVGGRRDLDFKITHAKHYKLILPHMARPG